MFMKKIILIFLMLICTSYLMAQSMEWLCRPGIYSDIQYMGFDLFKVKDSMGKWGVVSAQGKEVLSVRCDSITHFVENRALVLDKSGQRIIGILDSNGSMVKSFEDEEIFTTSYPDYH